MLVSGSPLLPSTREPPYKEIDLVSISSVLAETKRDRVRECIEQSSPGFDLVLRLHTTANRSLIVHLVGHSYT